MNPEGHPCLFLSLLFIVGKIDIKHRNFDLWQKATAYTKMTSRFPVVYDYLFYQLPCFIKTRRRAKAQRDRQMGD